MVKYNNVQIKKSIKFDEGGNYLEVAENKQKLLDSFSSKLYNSLLIGSGVACVAIIGIIFNEISSQSMRMLLFKSLWAFSICLILSYISGLFSLTAINAEVQSNRSNHNKQQLQKLVEKFDLVEKSNEFDDDAKKLIKSLVADIEVLDNRMNSNNKVFRRANVVSSIIIIGSMLAFIVGLFLPLVSITVYDYF